MKPSARAKLGVVVALLLVAAAPATSARESPLVNTAAPQFVLPVIANGTGSFDLRAKRGHGVYLNFFASWCQPCKMEARTLEKVTREPASRNIVVLGIAVLDNQKAALGFVHGYDLTYPIAFDGSSTVGAAYRVGQLPLHVFIGPDGRIRHYVPGGPIPENELRAGLASIAK